jgi:hypothetical protein
LKHRKKLNTSDKLEIAHKVVMDLEKQVDVAREFSISASRVSEIVKEARKQPEVIREAI